jgi:hypothetical protein
MSNPCFEIWLILHLKDINEYTKEELEVLYNNPKISNMKNHIDLVLGELQGRGYNKRPDPEIYNPLTLIAIDRAKKKLDNIEENYPSKIGSHLYKLIEKLITQESHNF